MNNSAPVPAGYERKELRTFAEADHALKRVNAAERRKIEQRMEAECAQIEANEKINHGALRMQMQQMSPAGRAFARLAMARAEQKRPRTFDANVYLDVRERDASNREAFEDSRTGWRNRKG